jgi:hypothetical protein
MIDLMDFKDCGLRIYDKFAGKDTTKDPFSLLYCLTPFKTPSKLKSPDLN